MGDQAVIEVIGEALIDLTPAELASGAPGFAARPGGSPYNVAVGLGRLGVPVRFLGRLSRDDLGQRLEEQLARAGVDLSATPRGTEPTAVALVTVAPDGQPTYRFLWEATADRVLARAELPDRLAGSWLHVGSVDAILEPVATSIRELIEGAGDHLLSLDPNVRPQVLDDAAGYRARVSWYVEHAALVKVSVEDLAWLEPDRDPVAVARGWLHRGPDLVVVTDGSRGATGVLAGGEVDVAAPAVEVVDAVGAGDAFTAGLLAWLHDHEVTARQQVAALDPGAVRDALEMAARVAAVTVSRPGADPPTRAELA